MPGNTVVKLTEQNRSLIREGSKVMVNGKALIAHELNDEIILVSWDGDASALTQAIATDTALLLYPGL